ncbi:MAG: hypothetical protein U9Q83_06030, partial [Bacteroidota bacterium]|nr:hypothetical protein [Bacteroidota bacterium]
NTNCEVICSIVEQLLTLFRMLRQIGLILNNSKNFRKVYLQIQKIFNCAFLGAIFLEILLLGDKNG